MLSSGFGRLLAAPGVLGLGTCHCSPPHLHMAFLSASLDLFLLFSHKDMSLDLGATLI